MVLDPEKNVLSLGNILLRSWRTNGVMLEKCFRFENRAKITRVTAVHQIQSIRRNCFTN